MRAGAPVCACAHARVYALRIVSMDKILCFINTFWLLVLLVMTF